MKKKKGLFFVTQIRIRDDEIGKKDIRCIGYYKTLKDARYPILHCDLQEAGYYQYALIEEFGIGWYPTSLSEEWYLITGDKPVKIDRPIKYDNVCNFGMG